jgi:predicted AAA+ superfamily ATPase
MDETSKQIEEYLKKYPHSSMGSIERRRRWLEKRVREDEQKRKVRAENFLNEKKGKTDTFEISHDNKDYDDNDSIFSGEEDYDPYLDEPDYNREERLNDMWDELHDPYWRQN